MRKSLIAAAVAAATLAVPAIASAQDIDSNAGHLGTIVCTDASHGSQTVNSNVVVPKGATCDLSWSDVKGDVTVFGTLVSYGQTTFEQDVNVLGGAFGAANWGVTLDKNLTIVNPPAYSASGFWGDYVFDSTGHIQSRPDLHPNVVKGSVTYLVTPGVTYPYAGSPSLYFGGGVEVMKDFIYHGGSTHLDTGGLKVDGHEWIS